jgi:adenylate kinase family enzyme
MHRKADFIRTLVLGNSGSGKSWLSAQLTRTLGTRATDLDAIHWEPDGYNVAREKQFAIAMVRQISEGETWIIEGVYGWLAREAAPRATAMIWLDIVGDECLDNLRERGLRRGGDEASFTALLSWATDYSKRQTSSSFAGHELLFMAFDGRKVRLRSRRDIAEFIEALSAN